MSFITVTDLLNKLDLLPIKRSSLIKPELMCLDVVYVSGASSMFMAKFSIFGIFSL